MSASESIHCCFKIIKYISKVSARVRHTPPRKMMMMIFQLFLFTLLFRVSRSCTSILIGPDASEDGMGFVGQSDDGEGAGDRRLVYVEERTHSKDELRPIIDYGDFPRYVGYERKIPEYYPSDRLPNETKNVIGHIPQVEKTFGYFEGNYAIANSEGVQFGESTVSAKIFAKSVSNGGPSLLSMYSLSRLAAERASTSREAVKIMGSLAEEFGFYGDPAPDTGGESLLVADSDEQFIFHVLAADEQKGGAIWCAQKIGKDEITIVANAFVIGFVDTNSSSFLYSENMHSIALKRGWWNGEDKLHFTRAFSAGEYTSRYYSGRRMWAFWNALAPSLEVPAEYDSYLASIGETYPVSAKPDRKVSRHDIFFNVYRNYYEGTSFDLSHGVAAGPFGTPVRYKPGLNEYKLAGSCGSKNDGGPCSHWERSIASFRSDLVALTQFGAKKSDESFLWFLPGSALSGVFVPLPVSNKKVPAELSDCLNTRVDRTKSMWAFRELVQFAYPRWIHLKDRIAQVASELEHSSYINVIQNQGDVDKNSKDVIQRWRELYNELLVQYSDGWSYENHKAGRLGYPMAWLKEVHYADSGVDPCEPTCI
jgi:dipeptidase